jgi:hypothetical protein
MRATCVLWAIQHTDLLLIDIDTKSKTNLVSPPNTRVATVFALISRCDEFVTETLQ